LAKGKRSLDYYNNICGMLRFIFTFTHKTNVNEMKSYKVSSFLWSLILLFFVGQASAQYKQTVVNPVSLTHDAKKLIPFQRLDELKIAVVTPSPQKYNTFIETLQYYADVQSFDFNQYDENTKYSNTIIVAGTAQELRSDFLLMAAQSTVNKKDVIIVRFGDEKDSFTLSSNLPSNAGVHVPDFTENSQRYAA